MRGVCVFLLSWLHFRSARCLQLETSVLRILLAHRILNKLTPEKYARLKSRIFDLRLAESEEKLKQAVSVIFEKAISEPHFAGTYSLLCQDLAALELEDGDGSSFREQQQQQVGQWCLVPSLLFFAVPFFPFLLSSSCPVLTLRCPSSSAGVPIFVVCLGWQSRTVQEEKNFRRLLNTSVQEEFERPVPPVPEELTAEEEIEEFHNKQRERRIGSFVPACLSAAFFFLLGFFP